MASPAPEIKGLVGNAGLLDLEAHDSNLLSDVRHTLSIWLQGCSACLYKEEPGRASTVVRCDAYFVAEWWTSSAWLLALQAHDFDLLEERQDDWLFQNV